MKRNSEDDKRGGRHNTAETQDKLKSLFQKIQKFEKENSFSFYPILSDPKPAENISAKK